ncbi:hypothetical protein ACFRR6_01785 [Streptomyces sp. NPDC056891]|uniref:hypothetical protein n=1 Tax=Streptomyces sp. NPDC056891 TaxID=3345961 RepID=UPI0036C6651E
MTNPSPTLDLITSLIRSMEARLHLNPSVEEAPPMAAAAPVPAASGAPGRFTVTAYVNVGAFPFYGYTSGDLVAEVTATDNTPLRLAFAGDSYADAHEAADAAFVVGNREARDDQGQSWPKDVRSLSVGDIVKVTDPNGTTIHLSVDSAGFSKIERPLNRTGLIGTSASSRAA